MTNQTWHLVAPAKLTWSLEITGVRDDGYHLLRSEMLSLDLADDLDVTDDGLNQLTTDTSAVGSLLLASEDNLIRRAMRFVGRTASVRLVKRIPVGGGLGGGSSDAGAILRWAGAHDVRAAVELGGDVPFCVHGGRAVVEGVGERVRPLPYEERRVTLVIAPFAVSTGDCYRAFDEMAADGWRPRGRNHLLEPAERVEPRLRELRQWVAAVTGCTVELCGSGSTLFVEGLEDAHQANRVVQSPLGSVEFRSATSVPAQLP